MKVPVFQRIRVVDGNGYFTPQIQQMLDVLFQQMQICLSDDGFLIPNLSTDDIAKVTSPLNPNAKGPGTFWYDSDTNEFKGNVNGVIKTFTVS